MNTPRLLREWRESASQRRLISFEETLAPICAKAAGSGAKIKRFGNSWHLGLLSQRLRRAAMKVDYGLDGHSVWRLADDAGVMLCHEIAGAGGELAPGRIKADAMRQAGKELLRRGVLFEENGRWHLPAELLMECARSLSPVSLYALAVSLPQPILNQLLDDAALASLSQPKPTVFEMAAWWAVHAHRSLAREKQAEWPGDLKCLVLTLAQGVIEDEEDMQRLFPDLDLSPVSRWDSYAGQVWAQSVRASLEAKLPALLREAMTRGLAGVIVQRGDRDFAALVLPDEARQMLGRRLKQERRAWAEEIRGAWECAEPERFRASLWREDHALWRVWAAQHFMDVRITRQRTLRKGDIKRLAHLLELDEERVHAAVFALFRAGLTEVDTQRTRLIPEPCDARRVTEHIRHGLTQALLQMPLKQNDPVIDVVWRVLRDVPTDGWLHTHALLDWLRLRAPETLPPADWRMLFRSDLALADVGEDGEAVRFPPMLAVLANDEPLRLSSSGWVGAAGGNPQARPFVSPVGEIQWPPDASLAPVLEIRDFLRLERIEHMLTLSVDDAALRRVAGDEAALRNLRDALAQWAEPLPPALARRLDRLMVQKPAALAASASMVLMVDDPAALAQIGKQGFTLHQPFGDVPGLFVLDADESAHAFLDACKDAGVRVEVAVTPRRWVEGQAAIQHWMRQLRHDEAEVWIEVMTQRSVNAAPKRRTGRAVMTWYRDELAFMPFRNTRKGWQPAKKSLNLRAHHIIRLRELDEDEIQRINGSKA
ncbi:MAG: hypothetical protein R8K47_08780 [Mariprofundaceae bacterium]